MGTNLMGELVANNGTFIVNSTDEGFTRTIDAIVVLEDTIFGEILLDRNNVLSDYVSNPLIAVKAGAIITPIDDLQFSGVNLVSGSVALVLG
jgi:hypothetical protein